MALRILDLDGSLLRQKRLLQAGDFRTASLADWGPDIRLACGFGRFARFMQVVHSQWPGSSSRAPQLTYYGSGDFHHVTLALLESVCEPINLLVLDNHPDWMRGVPFLHCGTWLYHAARLPHVRSIFHVGGDVDFDNYYRPLAPWSLLWNNKIRVIPGARRFRRGPWANIPHQSLREALTLDRPFAEWEEELQSAPLYISFDKDVLRAEESVVNWDSGHLYKDEVFAVLEAFLDLAGGRCAGMDVLGDWSPVRIRGLLRHMMHWTMHPSLDIDPDAASCCQETLNLRILRWWNGHVKSDAHPRARVGVSALAS